MGGLESRSNHSRRFRIAAGLAGWPAELQWRGLRHLAAVTMMAAPPNGMGLTLEETSKLLGHHSPEFTARRYLSLRSGWLDRAKTAAAAFSPGGHDGFGPFEVRNDSPDTGVRM
jgi:integrase